MENSKTKNNNSSIRYSTDITDSIQIKRAARS